MAIVRMFEKTVLTYILQGRMGTLKFLEGDGRKFTFADTNIGKVYKFDNSYSENPMRMQNLAYECLLCTEEYDY